MTFGRIAGVALSPLPPTDTRGLFRPVSSALVGLLGQLQPSDWDRPTVAGAWTVRDVLAHLVDVTFRRLAFHRDRMVPPGPATPITSERDFVNFINTLNAQWIEASKRFSPRVLTDLFEKGSLDLADWVETVPLDAPGLFSVSWAGERVSAGWFDIGRDFTELWHHQEQIRIAVGAPSLGDPRYLHAVLEIALRGLPHAYREVEAPLGATLVLDVNGSAGGEWSLAREGGAWTLYAGAAPAATTRVHLSDATAWQLLFNALRNERAVDMRIEGDPKLATPLLRARSVIV